MVREILKTNPSPSTQNYLKCELLRPSERLHLPVWTYKLFYYTRALTFVMTFLSRLLNSLSVSMVMLYRLSFLITETLLTRKQVSKFSGNPKIYDLRLRLLYQDKFIRPFWRVILYRTLGWWNATHDHTYWTDRTELNIYDVNWNTPELC